jgi:hypothetical protein
MPKSIRGAIAPLPQYVFMAWCLVKHKDNFTLNCTKQAGKSNPNVGYFVSNDNGSRSNVMYRVTAVGEYLLKYCTQTIRTFKNILLLNIIVTEVRPNIATWLQAR